MVNVYIGRVRGVGLITALFIMFILPAIVLGGTVVLPKTGQTTCYDTTGNVIDCAGTGQDGDMKAGVAWPNPRFTAGTGIEADCVTDNLTGLMWVRSPDSVKRQWQQAIDYANGLSLCGYSDWHLPNRLELESLINYGQNNSDSWLNTQGFSNVQYGRYSTSTLYVSNPHFAFGIEMLYSFLSLIDRYDDGDLDYVWPVRSGQSGIARLWKTGQTSCYDVYGNVISCALATGQDGDIQAGVAWPDPRFTVGTGTGVDCVTDNLTGLMWTRYANLPGTSKTWQGALDYANNLSLCGYTDWHLPDRKELLSLIDYSRHNPALPESHPFLNIQSNFYWSSTSVTSFPDGAWAVDMRVDNISRGGGSKSGDSFYVWPVRSTYCPHTDTFPTVPAPAASTQTVAATEGKPRPDYDIRLQAKDSPVMPDVVRDRAMASIREQLGEMVTVRWNRLNGTPRHLFNYNGYLTSQSQLSPEDVVRGFLRNNPDLFGLSEGELSEIMIRGKYQSRHNRVTHLSLRQYYNGIPVFQGVLKANVDKEGRILNIGGGYYHGIDIGLVPYISAADALRVAVGDVAPGIPFEPEIQSGPSGVNMATVFQKGPFNRTDGLHGASLVIFSIKNQFRLAWQVIFHKNGMERYIILVDAETGEILYRSNMVKFNQPQGLVFEEDPDDADQVTQSFEGDSLASTLGWLHQEGGAYSTLGGNNVCAQEDRDSNNAGGYSPRRPDGHFEYTFTNAYMNSNGTDVDTDLNAAVTNLFYMINRMHDYYYGLGFDEGAGNFQRENVSGLGLGNDEVQADVQNGWDTGDRNNSDFYTPIDGSDPTYGKPRMQVYLSAQPDERNVDGDFDGGGIIHEYTHGLSDRLVGGPDNVNSLSGIQSGAMSEGWGDWFDASIYDDPVHGEYPSGDTTKGVRRYALNNSPLTYHNLCGGVCEVHYDGEIWSATLWDLRTAFIDKYGYGTGKQKVEQLVVDAM